MRKGSFIFTSLMMVGLAVAFSLDANHRAALAQAQERTGNQRLADEGNAKLAEAETVRQDLANNHGVTISLDPKVAAKYDWRTMELSARREIQGKLALYLQLVNRVLEIDSRSLITIDQREQVLAGRDSAELAQKSIEKFEKLNGENFRPKADSRRASLSRARKGNG